MPITALVLEPEERSNDETLVFEISGEIKARVHVRDSQRNYYPELVQRTGDPIQKSTDGILSNTTSLAASNMGTNVGPSRGRGSRVDQSGD